MYEDLIQQITTKVNETQDEFIFQTISPWIESNYLLSISKDELAKAIQLVRVMENDGINIYDTYEKAVVLRDHYQSGYQQGYKDGCNHVVEIFDRKINNIKKSLGRNIKDDQN